MLKHRLLAEEGGGNVDGQGGGNSSTEGDNQQNNEGGNLPSDVVNKVDFG